MFEPTPDQIHQVLSNLLANEQEIDALIFTGHLGRNDTVPFLVYASQQQTKIIQDQSATISTLQTQVSSMQADLKSLHLALSQVITQLNSGKSSK